MGKIVAILSSPRQKGNSFDIVNAILDGAMGLSTNVIKLHRLDNLRSFHGCRACMGCKKSNACVQQDDVSQILEDMMDADCVIFSTPVYFGSPNAQYKVLEDRMFSFIHGDGSKAMTGKDVPKALFSCGIICLIMYFFVSTVVYGSLGQAGIDSAGYATLAPIAEFAFGEYGSYIALFFLIVAMILIIQTGFLGSSRTLHSMSLEGNLPNWFGKTNANGMPANAMVFVSIFNLLLVFIIEFSAFILEMSTTSMTVLTASALGYCIANCIALAAFYVTKTSPRFKDLERPFKAPRGWKYVILVMCVIQCVVFFPSLMYWSYYLTGGFIAIALALIILILFIPLWYWVQGKNASESSDS